MAANRSESGAGLERNHHGLLVGLRKMTRTPHDTVDVYRGDLAGARDGSGGQSGSGEVAYVGIPMQSSAMPLRSAFTSEPRILNAIEWFTSRQDLTRVVGQSSRWTGC